MDDYGYLSRVAAYMSAGGREGDYLMMVGNSFQENSVVFQGDTIPAWKRTLMIRGLNGMKTIGLGTGASNSLLTILSNNTITLSENITLQGNISSFPLVRINTSPGFPGTLVMEENAVITGHTNPGNNGGGVYVDGGTFTMNGGIIEGNRATNGGWGGVRVAGSSSSFYMPGGTIIGNTADVLGDSLCVQAGAIAKYGAPPAVGSDIITDPLSTGIDDPLTGHS